MMNMERPFNTKFWKDPVVLEEMTKEDKCFYLYILTNSHASEIGIYQISKKRIAFELGYSLEKIDALVERFIHHFDLIRYNDETREIAIKHWGFHNLQTSEKALMNHVKKELKRVKDHSLIPFVAEGIEHETVQAIYVKKHRELTEEREIQAPQANKKRELAEISR